LALIVFMGIPVAACGAKRTERTDKYMGTLKKPQGLLDSPAQRTDSATTMRTILVFGASSAVGGFLLQRLSTHYKVWPVSRSERIDWIRGDLSDTAVDWPAADAVISLGPLDAFSEWLQRQNDPPRRVVALSSMSAESKRQSPDTAERALAARLSTAETDLFKFGAQHGIACTVFRPTLIYGAGTDQSLAPIARFARHWHVLPIPLGATGLRQPVHAADLADACFSVIDSTATHGKTYALGGGERVAFAALLWRLRAAQPGLVVPIPVPLFALRFCARMFRAQITSAALARLRKPLVADNTHAQRDFGYAPRRFSGELVLPIQR
jgi:nucleoside-diphosphate-sugar epimerase